MRCTGCYLPSTLLSTKHWSRILDRGTRFNMAVNHMTWLASVPTGTGWYWNVVLHEKDHLSICIYIGMEQSIANKRFSNKRYLFSQKLEINTNHTMTPNPPLPLPLPFPPLPAFPPPLCPHSAFRFPQKTKKIVTQINNIDRSLRNKSWKQWWKTCHIPYKTDTTILAISWWIRHRFNVVIL